jgi:flagella synthesis protein FlgN
MTALLLDHLTQEHAAIGIFLDVLDQEASAMACGDFAALPALVERKAGLVAQIAQLDRQREMVQVSLGYAADQNGAESAAAAGGQALQTAWHDLREQASQARARNHRNGVMIHTHLDFTRQSINFLKAGDQPLYGPDGAHYVGAGKGNKLASG